MTDAPPSVVHVTIDGVEVEAQPGEMVIAAALRAGVHIPHFCYHPRMSPVGMCRMCLVDIDGGRGPMLQPSCMVPVADGMSVDTGSAATKRAQEGILELLLVNHPLDCPVCDKGGECPLQDQTVAYGPGESRFVEEKRHYEKPIPISDLVHLDRERCILCDRCTRFADEVAGDALIHFTERGNETQVLTFPDEPFSSYFSGNTVQICPVGALTAAPYRFKARPWDLDQVESTCTTCSVGCRVAVQSSRNQLVRYLGVDIDPVNHGWLCDRGRFDFEAVNSDARLTVPVMRDPSDDQQLVGTDWSTALAAAAQAIAAARPGAVGIIGGARLTNEDAYAWSKLARSVIGTDNVDAQLGDGLPAEVVLGLPGATIDEACAADVVLVIGPDLKESLPILHLRLRAAARRGTQVVELTAAASGIADYARTIFAAPGTAAVELARLLDSDDPLAHTLTHGRVVVVLGRGSLAESAQPTIDAAAVVRSRMPGATFLPALVRGNVRGALDMGLAPGILPGRVNLSDGAAVSKVWGSLLSQPGLDTTGMLEAAANGRIDTLILLGADPIADFPDRGLAERALAGAGTVIALDTFVTESVARADIVLPTSTYGEKGGTTTNLEGRVSRLGQKVTAPGTVRDDWMIAADLASRLGGDLGVASAEDLWREITTVSAAHADCTVEVLTSDAAQDGILITGGSIVADLGEPAEPPAVDAYALRLVAGRKLYDNATSVQQSPSLAGLAVGPVLTMNPTDMARLGLHDGERADVRSARTSVVLSVVGSDAVPRGVVAVPFNQPGGTVSSLIDVTSTVTDVAVEVRGGGR